jgi:hypothetical protein
VVEAVDEGADADVEEGVVEAVDEGEDANAGGDVGNCSLSGSF